jgi:signal transduction histidine kinase
MPVNLSRLYFIHITAIAAGILSTYFPGMDILVALLYLLLIGFEARRAYQLPRWKQSLTALIWQAPGILWALILITSFNLMGVYEYAIFLLQFWFTPLLGVISLSGWYFYFDKPIYYYLLIYLPFISFLYYLGIASFMYPKTRFDFNQPSRINISIPWRFSLK